MFDPQAFQLWLANAYQMASQAALRQKQKAKFGGRASMIAAGFGALPAMGGGGIGAVGSFGANLGERSYHV